MIESYERNVQYSHVLVYHSGSVYTRNSVNGVSEAPLPHHRPITPPRALPVEIPQVSCDITGT